MAERTPRTQETREQDSRPQEWRPPELLPMPDPDADWDFRWVRVSSLGELDPLSVSTRRREGWEFVNPQDMPEIAMAAMAGPESTRIEIGGLALAKMPMERAKARTAYFSNLAAHQLTAVDNALMRENDARMPLRIERNTKTSKSPR